MTGKYKKALILTLIPSVLNLSLSCYVFLNMGIPEFKGYLTGTALCIVLLIIWLIQVRKCIDANAIVLFKLTFGSFIVKFFLFLVVAFGGYMLFNFSRVYFSIAFLIGTILSIIIEVWFYISLIKTGRQFLDDDLE